MPTVAENIAHALARRGVTHIFGQSIPTAVILAGEDIGIKQVMYRTENAGGAMADGFAKASGAIGVVAAQNGPAATLLVPPLIEAQLTSTPILALVQDIPSPTVDRNAFQEIDHFALFDSCSKWTRKITDPARAVEYVDRAIDIAISGKPGPVVLLLPKDVLIAEVPADDRLAPVGSEFPVDRPRAEASRVSEAAALLAAAERPLVVAGGGVHRSRAAAEVARLQEVAGLAVATTNMGKGAVDETHPLSIGVIGNVMGERAPTHFMRDWVKSADVVLFIGTRTNENGTDSWNAFGKDAAFIHVDVDGREVGRNYQSLRLVGDARTTIADLTEVLAACDLGVRVAARPATMEAIARAKADHRRQLAERVDVDTTPIRPELVAQEIEALGQGYGTDAENGGGANTDIVLVADASYSTIWLAQYVTARRAGQQFIYPRGMAGLGWGMPMAMGAKAALPDSHVIALVGDGGFAHVWSEFETAVRMQLPLTVILLNNSILGFEKHSELVQFSRYSESIAFEAVDHVAVARACGAAGVRVERPGDLAGALRRAVASNVPTLIEVITDPDAYPPITAWERRRAVLPDAPAEV
ncbi:acetolactate synthase catalytic subunit [Mycolicibacterium setense]